MEVVCSKLLRDSFCFSIVYVHALQQTCLHLCGSSIIKYISGTAVAAADRLQRAQLTELRAERVTEVPQL